eukprot:scaffold30905_cov67-Phaeocystis_antarctica.AAC.3
MDMDMDMDTWACTNKRLYSSPGGGTMSFRFPDSVEVSGLAPGARRPPHAHSLHTAPRLMSPGCSTCRTSVVRGVEPFCHTSCSQESSNTSSPCCSNGRVSSRTRIAAPRGTSTP